ncbi:hypothetical protein RND71_037616 [Anisodus tanguticus]|uniref:Uncharacterized protein n=1 Tax=Anisodus tanguticus TaxID=243964 RepID=A0AAE1UYN8_9SOLA|nr:hypothetical protein RND71_037616 [Anisodus tanguticus]
MEEPGKEVIRNGIVEIDLDKAANTPYWSVTSSGSFLTSTVSLLRRLGNPSLQHSFRGCNKVADILSKQALKIYHQDQTPLLNPLIKK